MCGYQIEKLDAQPVLVITLTEEWDLRANMIDMMEHWRQMLEAEGEPLHCIIDIRVPPVPLFTDIIWGANEGARGPHAIVNHPLIRETLVITCEPLLRLAALGLRSEMYGSARINVYESVEEALASVKE
jgi:hypothetical protein